MTTESGLYRDRHMLVIDTRDDVEFPNRCVWDNNDTDVDVVPLTLWYLRPGQAVTRIESDQGLPVCSRCRQRAANRSRMGFAISAIAALVLVIALTIVFMYERNQTVAIVCGAVCLVSLVIALIALFVGKANHDAAAYAQAVFIDDELIWLQNVSQKFLEALPAWEGDFLRTRQKAAPEH